MSFSLAIVLESENNNYSWSQGDHKEHDNHWEIMVTITKRVTSKSPLNFLNNQKKLKVGVVFVMEVVEVVLFVGVVPVLLIKIVLGVVHVIG